MHEPSNGDIQVQNEVFLHYITPQEITSINLSCDIGVVKADVGQAVHISHEEETRQLNERHPISKVRSTNNKKTFRKHSVILNRPPSAGSYSRLGWFHRKRNFSDNWSRFLTGWMPFLLHNSVNALNRTQKALMLTKDETITS